MLKESGTDLAYALYADNNGSPQRPVVSIRQGGTTYVASGSSQLTVNPVGPPRGDLRRHSAQVLRQRYGDRQSESHRFD